jgi:hypothetical protein
MLRARALFLLLVAATLCAPSMAQRGHRNPPDIFQDQSHSPAALQRGPDPKVMLEQANQMKQLSDAIPDDIQKLSQGVISKDLSERLKKIEKLAKKLREQVQQ